MTARLVATDSTTHKAAKEPPYSASDNNANFKYPTLGQRTADTYAARLTATSKSSLHDSCISAFRWAN